MLSSDTLKYFLEKGVPVIAVIIAWSLGYAAQLQKNTKEDKTKLKRLLYNLLELHSCLSREKNFHEKINEMMDLFMLESKKQVEISDEDMQTLKRMAIKALREHMPMQKNLPNFEAATETIIKDLSEVDPIFAFELAGKFQISEKMNVMASYLSNFDSMASGAHAKNVLLTEVLRPQIVGTILAELEEYIHSIAKKLDRKTFRRAKSAIVNTSAIDFSDMPHVVQDYFSQALPLFMAEHGSANTQ